MELCDKELCTGCGACYLGCAKSAITMHTNNKGFLYPIIDESKCIECGKCRRICPILNVKIKENIEDKKTYACWSKDSNLRAISTSGGVFTNIAKYILSKDGVVFGAKFDENFKVIHDECKNLNELKDFRGSKYVQSEIGDSYLKAKKYLDNKVLVLFTGTPCQIAGLNSFLGKEYSNLLTMDIVCHGVPSPLIFSDYIKYIEEKKGDKIKNISFRYKKPSWSVFSMKIDFQKSNSYIRDKYKDPYLVGFLSDYYLRDSCHNCKFTNLDRAGDITVSDYWQYKSYSKSMRNNEKGISMVMINNSKGKEVFDIISKELVYEERSLKDAVGSNSSLSRSYPKNKKSDEFWEYYFKNGFSETVIKYLNPLKRTFRTKLHDWKLRNYYWVSKFHK